MLMTSDNVTNKFGKYTVKYEILIHDRIIFSVMFPYSSLCWNDLVPPKIEVFIQLLLHDSICNRNLLIRRHLFVYENVSCSFCYAHLETSNHLFLHCIESWKFFNKFMEQLGFQWCMLYTIDQALFQWKFLFKGRFQSQAILMFAYGINQGIWLYWINFIFRINS